MTLRIDTIVVGPFEVNCYLVWNEQTGDAVIFDPGADEDVIFDAVTQSGCTPRAILLTHGHGDHIAAVGAVKSRYDIPICCGSGEEELLANPSANVSAFLGTPIIAPPPDALLNDEDHVSFGALQFLVLSTPGHSPAGVCYLHETEGVLFCGDTLFAGSIGRTDLPGGSIEILLLSIRQKILTLPDPVICYPGHGPRTTVGAERRSNPFLTGEIYA
jgi:glyoxylase-like metal-dependent hydrolase (beta-lactamase superfamily II)